MYKLLLAALLTPISLYAQAMNYTIHEDAPLNEIVVSDCSESVAISGFVHGVIHLTRPAQSLGTAILETHVGPRGDMKAVGLDSGNVYNLTGSTFNRIMFSDNQNGASYINTFNVVGLFKVRYTYHVTMDGNLEEIKTYVDHPSVVCK